VACCSVCAQVHSHVTSDEARVRFRAVGPAGRVREAIAAAQRSRRDGFSTILSLMDGVSAGWAVAVAVDEKRLVLGTKSGSVLVLDFDSAPS
jgi:hypothetical protein